MIRLIPLLGAGAWIGGAVAAYWGLSPALLTAVGVPSGVAGILLLTKHWAVPSRLLTGGGVLVLASVGFMQMSAAHGPAAPETLRWRLLRFYRVCLFGAAFRNPLPV